MAVQISFDSDTWVDVVADITSISNQSCILSVDDEMHIRRYFSVGTSILIYDNTQDLLFKGEIMNIERIIGPRAVIVEGKLINTVAEFL